MVIWLSLSRIPQYLNRKTDCIQNDIMTDETLGVAEAKRRFSELIERVSRKRLNLLLLYPTRHTISIS